MSRQEKKKFNSNSQSSPSTPDVKIMLQNVSGSFKTVFVVNQITKKTDGSQWLLTLFQANLLTENNKIFLLAN